MDINELHAELESLGEEEVRRRLSEGGWVAVNDWVEDWLRFQRWRNERSIAKSARRSARVALINSIIATICAISAIIISSKTTIIQFISGLS